MSAEQLCYMDVLEPFSVSGIFSFICYANSALALFGMDVPINSTLVQMLVNLNLISKLCLKSV